MLFLYDHYVLEDFWHNIANRIPLAAPFHPLRAAAAGARLGNIKRNIKEGRAFDASSADGIATQMLLQLLVALREADGDATVYVLPADIEPTGGSTIIGTFGGADRFTVYVAEGDSPDGSWQYPAPSWLSNIFRADSQAPNVENLVIERDSNLFIMRPSDELLATIPVGARNFANRVALSAGNSGSEVRFRVDRDTWRTVAGEESASVPTGGYPDPNEMLVQARVSYREWLRLSMNRPMVDQDAIARQQAARAAAAQRYEAFAARPADPVQHVPTLPFVPHGLSSSRRWGIEVESGGARGVEAPHGWRRIGDGSLRSAWDGYVERQDFEPHDEEVTLYRAARDCTNDHGRDQRWYNAETDRDEYRLNPNYTPVDSCNSCGEYTEIVHREPRTITHHARNGDTGEFVSPILVSMHSNGLKTILDQLALQPQNDSAGVHVHVEANDLSNKQVATLIFGYDVLEPILEASYQREARRYCQRRHPATALEAARLVRGVTEPSEDDVRGGDRYVTLNTTALNEHGTIEFRAMGPVYDYDYLVRWAMLCRELVNLAKAGVTTKQFSRVKTWDDLLMLLAEHGKEYVRAAVYELTGDVGYAADLLKRDAEVTTEALDADLQSLLSGAFENLATVANNSTPTWRRLAETFARSNRQIADLVSVGGPSVSETWMR